MTVAEAKPLVVYEGNSSATTFPFDFKLNEGTARVRLFTGGTVRTLEPGEFELNDAGNPDGGSITYPTSGPPLGPGEFLYILRAEPYEQTVELINQQRYYPEILEDALDRVVLQTQQLAELASRSARVADKPLSSVRAVPLSVFMLDENRELKLEPKDSFPRGPQGDQGEQGWSPVLQAVPDGSRRVFRVEDWTGGGGEPPEEEGFVGEDGLVEDIAEGTDVRGPEGPRGLRGPVGDFFGFEISGWVETEGELPDPTTVDREVWIVRPPGDSEGELFYSYEDEWVGLGGVLAVDPGPIDANRLQFPQNYEFPQSAIPTFPEISVFHVAADGNDSNGGRSRRDAVRTIEQALDLAWSADEPTLIQWHPDFDVVTEGHLDMPDDCIIVAKHRTVVVRPAEGFEERNVFRMGSGCFIEGMIFEGWRLDSLTNPTEGFAVAFRPGAVIRRVPYAHKIAVRTIPDWGMVPPPLDPDNANPLVPRGGGVVLADGSVPSQYSIFPNIMTWGATPVSPNGIGYCARRGGLINAVNAVSMWGHKHFMALEGGQCILSACSTQFGDWAMHADGSRQIIVPQEPEGPLSTNESLADDIEGATDDIVDAMWDGLVDEGFVSGWTSSDEEFTRRDAGTFLRALRWVLKTGDPTPAQNFVKGLFDVMGDPVYSSDKEPAFIRSFELIEADISNRFESNATVSAVVTLVNGTLEDPQTRTEQSRITAIGHTWTATRIGVALTKIPPAEPQASIQDSILETNDGVVVATGQDDYGAALLARGPQGTLEVDPVVGLTGNLFNQAVREQALRASIISSFGSF